MVLALVHALRGLRRYFQGHPINVLIDYQISDVLRKPELSGRLAKWAIELGAHELFYKPRPTIKGQVLADFTTEVPAEKVAECLAEQDPGPATVETDKWLLYTDEAKNDDSVGAGLRLISPEGAEFMYAVRLNFESTNNEVEYES